jgi:sporulation protein YlmC with PRC-barrel domain
MLRRLDDMPDQTWAEENAHHDFRGYEVYGTDGVIGQVDDLVLDEATGRVRYFTIDLGGKKGRSVWLPKSTIRRLDHGNERVLLHIGSGQIQDAPAIPKSGLSRTVEQQLHDHFGAEYYW